MHNFQNTRKLVEPWKGLLPALKQTVTLFTKNRELPWNLDWHNKPIYFKINLSFPILTFFLNECKRWIIKVLKGSVHIIRVTLRLQALHAWWTLTSHGSFFRNVHMVPLWIGLHVNQNYVDLSLFISSRCRNKVWIQITTLKYLFKIFYGY